MSEQIITGITATEKIKINKIELAQRLKTDIDFNLEEINLCKQELFKVINYKYAYKKVSIELSYCDYVNFGFCKVKSKNLYNNLKGCSFAVILAVTAGIGVDRLLGRLELLSKSKCFITDAISSAAVESYCDYVNQYINEQYKTKPRFSPGYGDLPLEIQPDILNFLSADKTLGITLNESLLMTPVKSITAIIGVL